MNSLVVIAVVALAAGSVSAHGGGNKGGNKGGPGGGFFGRNWGDCNFQCSYQCLGNTGSKTVGCYTNRTAYIQCQDTTCTVQTCPENQLFNNTILACQSCPTGFQVNEQKTKCVCITGTTFNRTSRTCVACPTGSTITPDYCYCNNSAYDSTQNACRTCPADSTLRRGCCECNSRDAFWNKQAFACQPCPGQWVLKNVTSGGFFRIRYRTYNVCECQTAGQVFNRYSVSCLACPPDSVVATTRSGESYCSCSQPGFTYYDRNNTCVDRYSFKSNGGNDGGIEFTLESFLGDLFGSDKDDSSNDRSRG